MIRLIENTRDLARMCEIFAHSDYITVDTEFMRERTYRPVFCLLQIACPAKDSEAKEEQAVLVDPLSPNIDLSPFYDLLANKNVLKVFHAGKQDIEIFYHHGGIIPQPLYDTQIAAMVCGYGSQVGYDTLVRSITRIKIDKTNRITDWSKRPLSEAQRAYALADVTHLRDIYETLHAQIVAEKREEWISEEFGSLTDQSSYKTDVDMAWKRLRVRGNNPEKLATVRQLAIWRENEAQKRNLPRGFVISDDALMELANQRPQNENQLANCRLYNHSRKKKYASAILAVIGEAESLPEELIPKVKKRGAVLQPENAGIVDLLKPLLQACSAKHKVARELIASSADLETIATEDAPDVRAITGWRREIFGDLALKLKAGEIALSVAADGIKIVDCR